MLDQIESLMESIRQVSDNIAHDLKTPLSRLRQRLEALHDQPTQNNAQLPALDQAISEADQLLGTFNALLRIARIESGPQQASLCEIRLDAVAADAVELYEPLAEEKHQRLVFRAAPQPVVLADRDMLFQALANLLDNAVKYTPLGGIIEVVVAQSDDGPSVAVGDSGPGVATANREKIFRRFYRLDSSRSSAGNGLGLSLVNAVARLHRARIDLDDNDPGLRVTLTFATNGA
jgi:signal transduction histidine kinase